MNVVKVIGKAIALNSLGTILNKIIVFGNIFLILTHLSVYEYGLTELSLSVFSAMSIILLPGLASTIVSDMGVELARGKLGKVKALFVEYFSALAFLGIVGWAILFFGSSYIAHLTGNDLINNFLKIVSFLFLAAPLRALTTSLSVVMVRFVDQAFYSGVEEAIKFLLLCVFFLILGRGADGLLYAAVGAQFLSVLIFLPRTLSAYRTFSDAPAEKRLPFWQLLREHRKWSMGASYVASMAQNIRLWIIKLLLGTEAVGLFSFAFGLYSNIIALLPLSSVVTPLVPRYIQRISELIKLLRASVRLQLLLSSLMMLGALICGPFFVYILFPKYIEALPIFLILTPVFIPNSILSLFTPVFYALKEQRSFLYSSIIKVSVVIFSLPIFIIWFGLKGVAFEILLSSSINLFERYRRLRVLVPGFSLNIRSFLEITPEESAFLRVLYRRLFSIKII